jgi:S1-C subfamily serine protease
VVVTLADGTDLPAKVLGEDPLTDIAVLQVDRRGLPTVSTGRSTDLMIGEWVVALGNPYAYLLGNAEPTVTVGVVSATNRNILPSGEQTGLYFDMIQTDAAINPGNSGGPLVNARGEVVGINQQIKSTSGGGEGVGFAVPVDAVRRSVRALREDGTVEYAYLGVSTVELYPQLVERFDLPVARGVWLQAASKDGPADRAGLRGASPRRVTFQGETYGSGGDVITGLEGHRVADADDLSLAVTRYEPGDRVTVEAWRDGRLRRVEVTLGERPASSDELP